MPSDNFSRTIHELFTNYSRTSHVKCPATTFHELFTNFSRTFHELVTPNAQRQLFTNFSRTFHEHFTTDSQRQLYLSFSCRFVVAASSAGGPHPLPPRPLGFPPVCAPHCSLFLSLSSSIALCHTGPSTNY